MGKREKYSGLFKVLLVGGYLGMSKFQNQELLMDEASKPRR